MLILQLIKYHSAAFVSQAGELGDISTRGDTTILALENSRAGKKRIPPQVTERTR